MVPGNLPPAVTACLHCAFAAGQMAVVCYFAVVACARTGRERTCVAELKLLVK